MDNTCTTLRVGSCRRWLLLLLVAAVITTLACVDAAGPSRAVAGRGRSDASASVVGSTDNADDDDDDDDDAWDFMSDAAVVAAVEAQRRAAPCAESLDASYLNDDYCDCADGSDEPDTGACALVTNGDLTASVFSVFQCKSAASDDQRIAVSLVRDGVCDCCDGSDEAPGVCRDTCASRRRVRLDALHARRRVVHAAQATRATYASRAPSQLTQLHDELDEIVGRATALQRAFQYQQQRLEAHVEQTHAQPSEVQLDELRGMYAQLTHWQYTAYVHSKLAAPETFDASMARAPFVALVGQCFSFTVNEKQLKGGSANVIPREYVVVFCPFQNVTQTEPGYAQWQRAERESKTGVRESSRDNDDAVVQPPITMGVWNQWIEASVSYEITAEEMTPVAFRQHFDHGEPCVNGQERVVHVDVVCGDTNRVLSVEEPDMCVYAVRFETPAACSVEYEAALTNAIASIAAEQGTVQPREHEEL